MKKTEPKNPCKSEWGRKWLGLDITCPEVREMAEEAEAWAGALWRQAGPKTLVLAGSMGCGKTMVSRKLYNFANMSYFEIFVKHRLTRPLLVRYWSWPEVIDYFREGMFWPMEEMFDADVLFLDDIGAESDTFGRTATDKLRQVLSRRENRYSVITTNIDPLLWGQRFDVRVEDRLFRSGARIVNLMKAPSYSV